MARSSRNYHRVRGDLAVGEYKNALLIELPFGEELFLGAENLYLGAFCRLAAAKPSLNLNLLVRQDKSLCVQPVRLDIPGGKKSRQQNGEQGWESQGSDSTGHSLFS